MEKVPAIKFYKDAIEDIIEGRKTLEPRPRSVRWIKNISKSNKIHLTWGPRMQKPKVFAHGEILSIEVRPFESATQDDLRKVALGWENRTVEDFIKVYNDWFQKEIQKGFSVYWIEFRVTKVC